MRANGFAVQRRLSFSMRWTMRSLMSSFPLPGCRYLGKRRCRSYQDHGAPSVAPIYSQAFTSSSICSSPMIRPCAIAKTRPAVCRFLLPERVSVSVMPHAARTRDTTVPHDVQLAPPPCYFTVVGVGTASVDGVQNSGEFSSLSQCGHSRLLRQCVTVIEVDALSRFSSRSSSYFCFASKNSS